MAAANKLQELSDNIAAQSGLLDSTYAQIYGVPAPGVSAKTPTEDDLIMMADIQETVNSLIALTVSTDTFQTKEPDLFFEASNFLPDGESIPTPLSAYPVIANRGDTLEKISLIHLGDSNRAKEIAILNGLRAPYIDEKGFTLSISNAAGRSFIINDTNNLMMGQKILINGNGQASTRRTILNIENIGNYSYKVTVDGNSDLDRFGPVTSPYLKASKLGTVGPGDTILIPSGSPGDQTDEIRPTTLLSKLSYAEKIFKVDMALAANGDLKVDPSGDISRSYGYSNAIQTIRLALETEKGSLGRHPNYGLPNIIGDNKKISKTEIIKSIENRIKADPRFEDATVSVAVEGNTVKVRVNAQGAHGTGRIPVEFQIRI
jgi:hypothetical protein